MKKLILAAAASLLLGTSAMASDVTTTINDISKDWDTRASWLQGLPSIPPATETADEATAPKTLAEYFAQRRAAWHDAVMAWDESHDLCKLPVPLGDCSSDDK